MRYALAFFVLLALAWGGEARAQQQVIPMCPTGAKNAGGAPLYAPCGVGGTSAVVSGNVGGYSSGPVYQTATPANSSHAAGVSVGGLFTVPVARTSGGTGRLTNIYYKSTGASVGQLAVRVWSHNPTNTTCTDNSAFSGSNTDDQWLVQQPFAITPAAPASTTGDASTYGTMMGLSWEYATSGNTNIYICFVTVSTDTADENKAVYVWASGPQN